MKRFVERSEPIYQETLSLLRKRIKPGAGSNDLLAEVFQLMGDEFIAEEINELNDAALGGLYILSQSEISDQLKQRMDPRKLDNLYTLLYRFVKFSDRMKDFEDLFQLAALDLVNYTEPEIEAIRARVSGVN